VVSYFLRYFSSTSTEQISPDSAGRFTSFDPLRGERDHCKMVAIPTTKDDPVERSQRHHVTEGTGAGNASRCACARRIN
jgi:hypothetical protein